MPQVFAFMLAGAGVVAAMKWVTKVLDAQAAEAARRAEEVHRHAAAAVRTKDLGALEYDADAKVYRPMSR